MKQVSPDKERVLVSDSMSLQLLVFNRSSEDGALSLRQRLDLPASPDNIQLDAYAGELVSRRRSEDRHDPSTSSSSRAILILSKLISVGRCWEL